MDWDEFSHWGKRISDWAADYHKALPDLPVRAQTAPGEIAAQLPQQPPEHAQAMDTIMADFERIVMPGMTHWQHPRFFATDAVFKQFPIVESNVGTELGVEQMMQLAAVFRGNMEEREGWGWHDLAKWELFFNTIHEIGQVSSAVDSSRYITNEFVGPANDFDHAQVAADAEAYELSESVAAVDIAAIQARFYDNVIGR